MFGVGFSGNQQYTQIREFGTGQHTHMTFFLQMRQDQPLPVTVQHVLAAQRGKLQSTAPLPGLQQQMYLRIMTQGFKMPDAFHRLRQSFLVYNASRIEFHFQTEALPQDIFEDFHLHLSHDLHMDFPVFLLPQHMQLRFFLFQLA